MLVPSIVIEPPSPVVIAPELLREIPLSPEVWPVMPIVALSPMVLIAELRADTPWKFPVLVPSIVIEPPSPVVAAPELLREMPLSPEVWPVMLTVALSPWVLIAEFKADTPWELPVLVPSIVIEPPSPVVVAPELLREIPLPPVDWPVMSIAALSPTVLIAELRAETPSAVELVPVLVAVIVIEPPGPVVVIMEFARDTPSSVAELPMMETAASAVETIVCTVV